jgi:hypothetical protein
LKLSIKILSPNARRTESTEADLRCPKIESTDKVAAYASGVSVTSSAETSVVAAAAAINVAAAEKIIEFRKSAVALP